jgi:hypothetical protein
MKKFLFITTFFGIIAISCKKEPTLLTTQLSLKAGEISQISLEPNSTDCTFSSDNEDIATVSETGLVTARRLGSVAISVTKGKKTIGVCTVTVNANYKMYREPYFGFGSSDSEIKSYETRQILTSNTDDILYRGENSRVAYVLYLLNNYKYESCDVFITATNSNLDLLVDFISERYIIYEANCSFIAFISVDGKVGGRIENWMFGGQIYYRVVYFDAISTLSISALSYGKESSKLFEEDMIKKFRQK